MLIGVGGLTVGSAAWRLTLPDVEVTSMLSMGGGLVATGAGIALLYVQTAVTCNACDTSS